ncbi:hypothetical protein CDAR_457581 [Caerostris darwini]|uniref:Uncharacterized protein n=1 Tax=Caerostris darwini TaxID=1538125 RepID=A0AAV4M6A8_9ARAC|nr:hypothetical protein CDAR_457581 [Caerostris darwini]
MEENSYKTALLLKRHALLMLFPSRTSFAFLKSETTMGCQKRMQTRVLQQASCDTCTPYTPKAFPSYAYKEFCLHLFHFCTWNLYSWTTRLSI